jgi:DNA mismatch endonuclease (patch repair protein)
VQGLRSTADIVFVSAKVAVYVDGCFWHSCPDHATQPASNAEWWAEKLAKNRERDERADAELAALGWTVVRIWEHERSAEAADRVEAEVRART